MSLELDTVFQHRARSSSLVFASLRILAAEFRRYLRKRATHRALSGLTDHELRDIGLVRTHSGYRELHQDRLGADYWKD